jgi:hypothetical protein
VRHPAIAQDKPFVRQGKPAIRKAEGLRRDVEACAARPIGTTFIRYLQRTPDGEVYSELSFIAFRLAFTSFLTNVIGTGLPIGKLTMAFVVA